MFDDLGKQLLGLGEEAGEGVKSNSGVAEPVGGAQLAESLDAWRGTDISQLLGIHPAIAARRYQQPHK